MFHLYNLLHAVDIPNPTPQAPPGFPDLNTIIIAGIVILGLICVLAICASKVSKFLRNL